MDRIKRISSELLERYPDKFGTDFEQNKKTIKEIAVVRSKMLRNKVAGYITSSLRRQQARNQSKIASEMENEDAEENIVDQE
jgi:small subunit ribosomal protein S17e